MNAMFLGVLIGLAALQLTRSLISFSQPTLSQRIGQFVPGFRSVRANREFDLNKFIRSSVSSFKSQFADQAISRTRREQILVELPDYLDMLSVAASAGESLYASLRIVNSRAKGLLASEVEYLLSAIDMGSSLEDELNSLVRRVKVRHIEEFANKVILAQRRGTPLARVLREHSTAIRDEIRNNILAQAGKNETKMFIPLVFLILPTTVLFAVYPSLQLLNFNYQ